MIKRLKSSLAFRLPLFYKKLLQYKKLRAPQKPSSNRNVLMMTGKNHVQLLRWSVFSIARNWHNLPKLTVINDGSISNAAIKKTLRFWQGELHIVSWQQSAVYHKEKNREALIQYATSHPFGKKMAVILHYAEIVPILWVDSDILFFQDPELRLPVFNANFICGGTEDELKAYDHRVLALLPPNNLHTQPGINAGMLYVYGRNIYEDFQLGPILEQVHPGYEFLTEQTIFAYVAGKSAGILWDKRTVKSSQEDNQQIRVPIAPGMMARHYTSIMRQLFWRDVMFNL
ncbi:hypothetical protein C8P68_105392 [Mucilaginibacter yixingensis]|uniref:Glycosyl transferase-like sugar-binding protein n=1 Tax=Mucilaginibacter yixingensis TaxID=1295612 RepID=A0A2T5J8V8_9SPHI|nr:hypothetical protein [Mucilaginibacter yixingensis]PTQ95881.1 hypothetical protein C8P68_105392 [Mucilaginibacter yixingensis]